MTRTLSIKAVSKTNSYTNQPGCRCNCWRIQALTGKLSCWSRVVWRRVTLRNGWRSCLTKSQAIPLATGCVRNVTRRQTTRLQQDNFPVNAGMRQQLQRQPAVAAAARLISRPRSAHLITPAMHHRGQQVTQVRRQQRATTTQNAPEG